VAEAENEASQCSQLQDAAEAHSEQLQELQAQLEQVQAALAAAQSASEELQEDAGAAKDQAAALTATNQRLIRELEQVRGKGGEGACVGGVGQGSCMRSVHEGRCAWTLPAQVWGVITSRAFGSRWAHSACV
jgi:predicted  nucleic acid-binding Zn-ribbon protein